MSETPKSSENPQSPEKTTSLQKNIRVLILAALVLASHAGFTTASAENLNFFQNLSGKISRVPDGCVDARNEMDNLNPAPFCSAHGCEDSFIKSAKPGFREAFEKVVKCVKIETAKEKAAEAEKAQQAAEMKAAEDKIVEKTPEDWDAPVGGWIFTLD